MPKVIDTKSLRFKLWIYFILFTAIIMFVLWTLQSLFLSVQYKHMKLNQINKIGNTIAEKYGQSDFAEVVYRLSYQNGLVVRVFDESGEPILSSGLFGDFKPPRTNPREIASIISTIKNSRAKYLYTIDDDRIRSNIVIYGKELTTGSGERVYLYINSTLAPLDSATVVLQNQLVLVTVISIVFAFILSYFLSKKLSRPITKITESAEVLARGDYNIAFEEDGYTEVMNLARSLNHTAKELSKTDELRRDLIANVSHDLRTPLTIIKSYAEMIRDISGDNKQKRDAHAKVIVDESDRLSLLVNDILDLSKIESKTAVLNDTGFDLSDTVKNILNHFNLLSETQGYVFDIDCESDAFIMADEQKMKQVVYNLISNAINYTGEDKTVAIRVFRSRDKVRFEVRDTGEGISPDEIERIWDRYYKSSQTGRRVSTGTGVGLAIVKGILKAHNADFGVVSKPGQGSVFWFEIKGQCQS